MLGKTIIGSMLALICGMSVPCSAWEMKAGIDQNSGRRYAVVQQWSHDERTLLAIECQNGAESVLFGIVVVDPMLIAKINKQRLVDIRVGGHDPIKVMFVLEKREDLVNFVLTNQGNRESYNQLVKLFGVMHDVAGDMSIILEGGIIQLFIDNGRADAMDRWRAECAKHKQ